MNRENDVAGSLATVECGELSAPEKRRLATLERTIREGRGSSFEVGMALREIQDSKLYRAEFATFEAYCRGKLDLGKSHAYRLIDCCELRERLSPIGDFLPQTESQFRPLTKLPPEEQPKAWQLVLDRTESGKAKRITASIVEDAVRDIQRDLQENEPPEQPPEPLDIIELLERLDSYVLKLAERCPPECRGMFADALRNMADDICEGLHGGEGRNGHSAA